METTLTGIAPSPDSVFLTGQNGVHARKTDTVNQSVLSYVGISYSIYDDVSAHKHIYKCIFVHMSLQPARFDECKFIFFFSIFLLENDTSTVGKRNITEFRFYGQSLHENPARIPTIHGAS